MVTSFPSEKCFEVALQIHHLKGLISVQNTVCCETVTSLLFLVQNSKSTLHFHFILKFCN